MKPASTPSHASASAHQRRSRSSNRPVRDASDCSATSAAPSDRATHSGTPSQRTAAPASGRCERCQRSLLSVHRAEAGRPVRISNSGAPRSALTALASSAPRESCQAIAGPTGRPRASSRTPVSAMPATPTPTTAPAGGCGDGLRGHGERRLRERVRIELRSRRHLPPRGPRTCPCELLAVAVEDHRLAEAGPHVDAEEHRAHVSPRNRRSRASPPCGGARPRRGSGGAARAAGRRPPSTAIARR